MKTPIRGRHFARKLKMAVPFLIASNMSISSSFSECYLTAQVIETGSSVNSSEMVDIRARVISLNDQDSYLCTFAVGQEIKIGKTERAENLFTAIQPGAIFKMHYSTYSGLGENGVAVSGEQWRILELVSIQEERQNERTDATPGN